MSPLAFLSCFLLFCVLFVSGLLYPGSLYPGSVSILPKSTQEHVNRFRCYFLSNGCTFELSIQIKFTGHILIISN